MSPYLHWPAYIQSTYRDILYKIYVYMVAICSRQNIIYLREILDSDSDVDEGFFLGSNVA